MYLCFVIFGIYEIINNGFKTGMKLLSQFFSIIIRSTTSYLLYQKYFNKNKTTRIKYSVSKLFLSKFSIQNEKFTCLLLSNIITNPIVILFCKEGRFNCFFCTNGILLHL